MKKHMGVAPGVFLFIGVILSLFFSYFCVVATVGNSNDFGNSRNVIRGYTTVIYIRWKICRG